MPIASLCFIDPVYPQTESHRDAENVDATLFGGKGRDQKQQISIWIMLHLDSTNWDIYVNNQWRGKYEYHCRR